MHPHHIRHKFIAAHTLCNS